MNDTSPVELHQLTPQHTPQQALAAFINDAKTCQFIRHPEFPTWEDSSWNLETFSNRTSLAAHNASISWTFVGRNGKGQPIPKQWADLVKALLISKLRSVSDAGSTPLATGTVRSFGVELRKFAGACVTIGMQSITEITIEFIEEFVSQDPTSKRITMVNFVAKALTQSGCTPQLLPLKPFKQKIGGSQQVDPSKVKPVNWDEIVALAAAYQLLEPDNNKLNNRADYNYMRVNVMLANLLASAPARVSELWRLPADCRVVGTPLEELGNQADTEVLDFKFGLCWFPVKGGRPVIKPIPAAMQKIAHRCVEVLAEYSDEARKTAKFIIENPGVLPIPPNFSDIHKCRSNGTITAEQIHRIMGSDGSRPLAEIGLWREFRRTRATRTRTGNARTNQLASYCFKTFETEWWEIFQAKFKNTFRSEWPYVVDEENYKLRADNALLLFYQGQIDSFAVNKSQLFFDTPAAKALSNLLRSHGKNISLWQRLGITLPNGQFPGISTHQIRHFLNTMAQRAGVPEPIIAMWSGRTSITQNASYDHRTDAERLRQHGYHVQDYDHAQVDDLMARQVEQAFVGNIGLPSVKILSAQHENIKELQKRRLVSITQIGFCIGDTRTDPCPHAMGCLNCSRLVLCKGAMTAKQFIEQKIKALEAQLTILKHHLAEEGGIRIRNEQIIPHLEEQIGGAKDLLLTLNDPNIENGAIITRAEYRGALTGTFAARVDNFRTELNALGRQEKGIADADE